ncbi:phospholipase C/S1-P1 nuclease domain-containing protein [Rhizobium sp. N113]|uniref:S1/P1 nuclease n=1 Tax=unclassified Rhizobium TaxID=2613769 RepID=UPI0007E9B372|nr:MULTISPECIES: S1/P1 nuclease [unclassified Rhizobium]ANL10325.1 phospholipase C/S1-P1 nuclease domain-containing protein [Rhizobium sp. N1341]ANL22376.1 phospholipase C/S1-P1 nuclease domain-containing protein [Rhizobium sp. N113]ANM41083.1 phospholipase C/S1-P1 nuclease domain-containing protein [Rhizobium sp. N741]
MFTRIIAFSLAGLWSTSALAWWDEGHMRVAAMAYELLTPGAKAEANRLIRINPQYGEWAAAVPHDFEETPEARQAKVDRYTFIRAAVWADDVKEYPQYKKATADAHDGATSPDAGRNIGYSDLLLHKYWHFKDLDFSTDGTPFPGPDPVDAITQIKLFTAALPASTPDKDPIRSYDLVWLLHLVGDVHQPLHASALYSRELPKGDGGGNGISVLPASGQKVALHAYWDSLFGGYSTVYGAIFDTFGADGKPRLIAPAEKAAISDPDVWLSESFELAKSTAYAYPVSPSQTAELTRLYETNARKAAEERIALAGARLANLLNSSLR